MTPVGILLIIVAVILVIVYVRYISSYDHKMYQHIKDVVMSHENVWADHYGSEIKVTHDKILYRIQVLSSTAYIYINGKEIDLGRWYAKKLYRVISKHRYQCSKDRSKILERRRAKEIEQLYNKMFPDYGL